MMNLFDWGSTWSSSSPLRFPPYPFQKWLLGTTIGDKVLKQLSEEKGKEVFPRYWYSVLMNANLYELSDSKVLYEHLEQCIIEEEWSWVDLVCILPLKLVLSSFFSIQGKGF